MSTRGYLSGLGLLALSVAALAVAPAIGAPGDSPRKAAKAPAPTIGYFTPAAADPKLSALFARGGLQNRGFRFTPVVQNKSRAITVAVRAAVAPRNTVAVDRTAPAAAAAAATANIGITPVAYNLGAAMGWNRFAVQGDVRRVGAGVLPGREGVDLGVSYSQRKWSTRVQVAAERPVGPASRAIAGGESVSVDVGGSFRLTRNLDVTAGVRYRTDRDRLQGVADDRRDSQAVYLGTAFRF